MTAIFIKEIKSYFKSLFGWIYLAVFTFFAGLYFIANNILSGAPNLSYTADSMIIIVICILPFLTMRIVAEEKKQKTDQFLITAPISLWKVVLGKFLSLAAIMLISTLIIAVGGVVRRFYGEIPVMQTLLSLGLFFLFGCTCIAIGMFLSSITEHQFIAAILTYGVYFFTMLVPGFAVYLLGAESAFGKIFNAINIFTPLDNMDLGILNLKHILYYVSVIALFIYLTYKIFAKNSVQLFASGKISYFISSIGIPLAIAVVIGINVGCSYIPGEYTEFDVTANKYYSVSEDSEKILDSLDGDYTIYVLSDEDSADVQVKKYMNDYDKMSDHIKVEYISTKEQPYFYMDYTNSSLSPSSLIVVKDDKSVCLDYYDLFVWTYNASNYTYEQTGVAVESQVTTALYSLMNDLATIHVYTTSGHNELPLTDYVTDNLKKVNYVIEDAYLVGAESVPENCDLLIINSPASDFNKDEVDVVKKYIDEGGSIIWIAAASYQNCTNLDSLYDYLGLDVADGIVLERDYRYLLDTKYPNFLLVSPDSESRFFTGSGKRMFFGDSRGFLVNEEKMSFNDSVENIFTSSADSYIKNIDENTVSISYNEGDPKGPFSLGLIVTKLNESTGAVADVALIGSPAFLYNEYDQVVSYANSEIFSAIARTITDNELVPVIADKSFSYEMISVPIMNVIIYAIVCCIVLPVLLIGAGIVILVIRRRK